MKRPPKTASLFDFAERSVAPAPMVPRLATARSTDPSPSHEAAREMNESGYAASICGQIETILANDDHRAKALTPGEIGDKLNEANHTDFYDSVKVCKRLNDLRKLGLAATFGNRRCVINTRSAAVWVHGKSCCANAAKHIIGRLPDGKSETVQCGICFKGLGLREISR